MRHPLDCLRERVAPPGHHCRHSFVGVIGSKDLVEEVEMGVMGFEGRRRKCARVRVSVE